MNDVEIILNGCSQEQRSAICYDQGHLIITAGPGTGKTFTLIRRIAYQIQKQHLKASQQSLAITFTRKAAQEMQTRLAKLSSINGEHCCSATFHQWCLRLLQQLKVAEFIQLAIPNIAQPEVITEILTEQWNDGDTDIQKVITHVSELKSKGVYHADSILERYNQIMNVAGFWDYDDILIETCRIIQESAKIREWIFCHYPLIYVDEYQDVNSVQVELLKLIVGPQSQLTVIGDPNQSIYGFRGSQVQSFQDFEMDFSNAHRMHLSNHYRSGQQIVDAAKTMLKTSANDFAVELKSHVKLHSHVACYEAKTPYDEASFVVNTIEKLVGGISLLASDDHLKSIPDNEYGFGDIAILYRLHRLNDEVLKALDKSGIPFQEQAQSGGDLCPSRGLEGSFATEKVNLMSLHASKGLEFNVVFMIGCDYDVHPLNIEPLIGDAAEEARLFYVGMTRAKQALYMTSSKRYQLFGQKLKMETSAFVKNVPVSLIESIKPVKKRRRQKHPQLF